MQMKIVFSPCPRYDWVRSGAISRSGRAYDGGGLIEFEASKPRVAIKQEYTPMVKLYPV